MRPCIQGGAGGAKSPGPEALRGPGIKVQGPSVCPGPGTGCMRP